MSYTSTLVFFNATPMTQLSGPELACDLVTALNLDEADDDLGGVFAWNSQSEAVDDATNVFQPSSVSGAGRWIRVSGQPTATGSTFTTDVTLEQDLLLDDASVINWNGDTTISRFAAGIIQTKGIYSHNDGSNSVPLYAETTAASVAAVYADASGAAAYAVVAEGDATTPVKAALRLVPQDTAPSSPLEGDIYANSASHKLFFYDGTSWKEVAFV